MNPFIAKPLADIEREIDAATKRLVKGDFPSLAHVKEVVGRLQGLTRARDILKDGQSAEENED